MVNFVPFVEFSHKRLTTFIRVLSERLIVHDKTVLIQRYDTHLLIRALILFLVLFCRPVSTNEYTSDSTMLFPSASLHRRFRQPCRFWPRQYTKSCPSLCPLSQNFVTFLDVSQCSQLHSNNISFYTEMIGPSAMILPMSPVSQATFYQ